MNVHDWNNLVSRVDRLQSELQYKANAFTIAQGNVPRDVFLAVTVEIPGGTPTYPKRTNPDDGDEIPRVYPFRFCDADFVEGSANSTEVVTTNRTIHPEPLSWGYSVSGLYLPLGTLCYVLQRNGLRENTDEVEYGFNWLMAPGETHVRCVTKEAFAKGTDAEVYVADDDDNATLEVFKVRNKFKSLPGDAFCIATQIGRRYYLTSADC